MASGSDADARAAELAVLPGEKLVDLLRTTYRRADFDAVARVLKARDRRFAEAKAALADIDALRKKHGAILGAGARRRPRDEAEENPPLPGISSCRVDPVPRPRVEELEDVPLGRRLKRLRRCEISPSESGEKGGHWRSDSVGALGNFGMQKSSLAKPVQSVAPKERKEQLVGSTAPKDPKQGRGAMAPEKRGGGMARTAPPLSPGRSVLPKGSSLLSPGRSIPPKDSSSLSPQRSVLPKDSSILSPDRSNQPKGSSPLSPGRSILPKDSSPLSPGRRSVLSKDSSLHSPGRSVPPKDSSPLSPARSNLPKGSSPLSPARSNLPKGSSHLSPSRSNLPKGSSPLSPGRSVLPKGSSQSDRGRARAGKKRRSSDGILGPPPKWNGKIIRTPMVESSSRSANKDTGTAMSRQTGDRMIAKGAHPVRETGKVAAPSLSISTLSAAELRAYCLKPGRTPPASCMEITTQNFRDLANGGNGLSMKQVNVSPQKKLVGGD